MSVLGGYCGKILRVDLEKKEIREETLPEELLRKYLGGSGIGARLLYDMTDEKTDPLGPGNPLIYMTGPFAGTPVPTSGRHQIIAKSPLTGIYGEGDVGGTWGAGLKRCGFDGIVIEGQSGGPVYILIEEGKASLEDAGFIWGKDTYETDRLIKERHGEAVSVSCIGPSGEKLVKLSSIMHDGKDARAVGRTGLGAVMGSKKLKAVVVSGSRTVKVADENGLKQSIKDIAPGIVKNTNAIKQHGTAAGVIGTEVIGDFPLKNWSGATWDKIENVSGQRMTETILTGRYFCESCIIGCGREVEVKEGPFVTGGAGPEYETIGTLGGMCLVDNLEAIAHGSELCNRYGIDTISTGSAIAFAMELYEKCLIGIDDTGGIELTWGNAEAMVEMIHRIGRKEGIGELLGNGVREAAARIGGRAVEYAIHVKGLEFPAHDPRAYNSLALGYATSNRGACHLQGASYFFEKTATMPELGIPEPKDRHRLDDQGEFQKNTQNIMCLMDSLKLCKFLLYGGVRTTHMREWLKYVVGWDIGFEELMEIGDRVFNLKRMYNVKCGISRKDDTLPPRILSQPRREGGAKGNLPHLGRMLNEYYTARGWDDDGIPKQETLEKLRLTW
ncbi:MAG: aldehyde ferredoxin oxidoreductase family protein [Bacillota bacterium]|nr:aldehyde ferredoxin oxidoreductase family protein [Bacillota bacterium]